jgi:hypothetical protein
MFKPGREKARPGILWKEKILDLNAACLTFGEKGEAKTEFCGDLSFLGGGTRRGMARMAWTPSVRSRQGRSPKGQAFDLAKVRLLARRSKLPKILCLARITHYVRKSRIGSAPTLLFMKPTTAIISLMTPSWSRRSAEAGPRSRAGCGHRPRGGLFRNRPDFRRLHDSKRRLGSSTRTEEQPPADQLVLHERRTLLGPCLVSKDEISDPHKHLVCG